MQQPPVIVKHLRRNRAEQETAEQPIPMRRHDDETGALLVGKTARLLRREQLVPAQQIRQRQRAKPHPAAREKITPKKLMADAGFPNGFQETN